MLKASNSNLLAVTNGVQRHNASIDRHYYTGHKWQQITIDKQTTHFLTFAIGKHLHKEQYKATGQPMAYTYQTLMVSTLHTYHVVIAVISHPIVVSRIPDALITTCNNARQPNKKTNNLISVRIWNTS